MDVVTIARIDKSNWKAACSINISSEQKRFLSDVAYCLARAYMNPYQSEILPFVILFNDIVIGFFWITLSGDGLNCVIGGFRIDLQFQRHGYAVSAMKQLKEFIRENYKGCRSMQVFVDNDNEASTRLVSLLGFRKARDQGNETLWVHELQAGDYSLIDEDFLDDG
jgi:ribosomal protein S18 acetylase RimI-like enzyme